MVRARPPIPGCLTAAPVSGRRILLSDHAARRRYCVFTSAGDRNNLAGWFHAAAARDWDLVAVFYGDDPEKREEVRMLADKFFVRKGSKFQNLKSLFDEHPGLFEEYDYVMVCDDDIIFPERGISIACSIAQRYDFWISQPSFSADSTISHGITRNHYQGIRITNFVEMTCPIFRRDKLVEFLQVYDGSLVGWGIDWWYCNHFQAQRFRKFAIFDQISVTNPPAHWKPGGMREIDRLQPLAQRKAAWQALAGRLNLIQYPYHTLDIITPECPQSCRFFRRILHLAHLIAYHIQRREDALQIHR